MTAARVVLDDGGIPVWYPSRRAALDALAALTAAVMTSVDYPATSTTSAPTVGAHA